MAMKRDLTRTWRERTERLRQRTEDADTIELLGVLKDILDAADVHIIIKSRRPYATVHANNEAALAWLNANKIPRVVASRYVTEYAAAVERSGLTLKLTELPYGDET